MATTRSKKQTHRATAVCPTCKKPIDLLFISEFPDHGPGPGGTPRCPGSGTDTSLREPKTDTHGEARVTRTGRVEL